MNINVKDIQEATGLTIEEIERLNELLNPQNFVKYKNELNKKMKVLEIIQIEDLQKGIDKLKLNIQKIFLKCFENKIQKAQSKKEVLKLIYEFRYYKRN